MSSRVHEAVRRALRLPSANPESAQVAANAGWLLADKVVRLVVGVGVAALVLRHLGPDLYGSLIYAMAVVALIGAATAIAADTIVLRDLLGQPAAAGATLTAAMALRLAAAAACLAASLVFAWTTAAGGGGRALLITVLAFGLLAGPFDVLEVAFLARGSTRPAVVTRMLAVALAGLVRVALVVGGAGVVAFACAQVLELALGAVGLVVAYRRTGGELLRRPRRGTLTTLARDSWPLLVSGIAVVVYMRVDSVVLEALAGNRAVGIYGAATRLSEMAYLIPLAVVPALTPGLLEARAADRDAFRRRSAALLTAMVALAYLVALPTTFLAGPLVRLLFGPQYVEAGPVLALHIWTCVTVFIGVAQSAWLVAEGLQAYSVPKTIAGALVNVALNFGLIPRYGIRGAALAALAGQAVAAILSNAVFGPTRPLFRLQLEALLLRGLLWDRASSAGASSPTRTGTGT